MPRSSLPPIWENFGLNVGSHIHNGGWQTIDGVQEDVDYHKSIGLKYIRSALRPFKNSTSAYALAQQALLRSMIQMYRDVDIDVQLIIEYGGGYDPDDTTTNDGYEVYLADNAAWAESLGITRIQIDNETEAGGGHASGVTNQQIYDWLQTLPAVVEGAGFTGEITYTTVLASALPHLSAWVANGLGNFDDIGLDVYGPPGDVDTYCKQAKAIFGDNCYLGEWSVTNSGDYWNFHVQDPLWVEDQVRQLYANVKINFPNHVNYYFCWKNANDGPDDACAASFLIGGELQRFWYSLISQRSPIVW